MDNSLSTWRKGVLVAAAFAATVSNAAAQEDHEPEGLMARAQISGSTRLDYYQSSTALDDHEHLVGATVQVKALPRLSGWLSGKVEARFSVPELGRPQDPGPRGRLLEGYATARLPHVDLRIGRQIVAWGRADGINPTDNLTPRDYRVLLPNDEDQRFGIWAARLDASLTETLTLTTFVSPDFTPSEVPLPSSLAIARHVPRGAEDNLVVGLKLDRSGGSTDWSLSYYHGASLLPTVQSAGSSIALGYDRTTVLGADIARNFGRFGFRGELAYTFAEAQSVDPNASEDRLFLIAGVDRTFGENLNLNVQALLRAMPDRRDPGDLADASARATAALNATMRGQDAKLSPGVTFRVSNVWRHNTVRAELFGVANTERGDFYLRPLASYDITDRVRLSAGANLFSGERDTQYGLQRKNSGVFVELRHGF